MSENSASITELKSRVPVRGSLRLTVNTSSPQVTAGSDFSIFVVIQNPFDVPITIQQVQTHIPIELIDVNGLRLALAQRENATKSLSVLKRVYQSLKDQLSARYSHSGIAIAVGTDFDPTAERDFVRMSTSVDIMGEVQA